MTYEINDPITFTTSTGKTYDGIVEGRNWWGESVSSYIVKVGYETVPVNAKSLKCEILWN